MSHGDDGFFELQKRRLKDFSNLPGVTKLIINDQKLLEDTERKLAWERLQKNIVMDGDTKIDKRTGEVWSPEVDSMYWKDKF